MLTPVFHVPLAVLGTNPLVLRDVVSEHLRRRRDVL